MRKIFQKYPLFAAGVIYLLLILSFVLIQRFAASRFGLNYTITSKGSEIARGISRRISLDDFVSTLPGMHFEVQWNGYWYTPGTSLHPFQTSVDDKIELRIDNNVALISDVRLGTNAITKYLPISKGIHKLEADYRQETGNYRLFLQMNHESALLEFVNPPVFFAQVPTALDVWIMRFVYLIRSALLLSILTIPLLFILWLLFLIIHRKKEPGAVQSSFVRIARIVVPVLIVLYASALRFEALTIKHGIAKSPGWVNALQQHASGLSVLHPETLKWRSGSNPYDKGDPINYLRFARAMKNFYAAQFREPFYVFWVKQSLKIFNNQDIAVSFASGLFSVLAVFATFLLGRAAFGWWTGTLASFGMAVDQELVSIGVDGWRDDTFMFLVLMFSFMTVRLYKKASFTNAIFAGLIGGIVCLTRMTSFSFIVPAFIYVVLFGLEPLWKNRLKAVTLSSFILAIVIAPFLINCAIVYGDPLFSVNDNTKFYRARENIRADEAESVASYLAGRLRERPWKFIDTGVIGLTRYPFLNKWKGFNYISPQLTWFLTGFALIGTLMFLFSGRGRLVLLLLISSLIPYAFTYEIPGGFEWRFTMHAYPFYMIGAALFIVTAAGSVFGISTWKLFSDIRFSKRSLVAAGAAVLILLAAGWISFNELNFLRKKEAVQADEAILVTSGERDSRFIGEGWYPPVRTLGDEARLMKGNSSVLRFPLKSGKDYNLVLRIKPAFEKKEKPSRIELRMNDKKSAEIEIKEPVNFAYVLQVPQESIVDGINELRLTTSGAANESVALYYWKVRAVDSFQQGLEKYENGQIDEAIALLEESIRQPGKRKARSFYYLGKCFIRKGEPQRAIQFLTQGLAHSRRNPEILEARAEAYLLARQPEEALADLKRVLKNEPNSQTAKRLLEQAKQMN